MVTLDDIIPLPVTDWIAPEDHPLRGEPGQMLAFAIRHAAGLLLFETGFGRDHARIDARFSAVHHPIESQLERHGLTPGDVCAIVNSHLHFDHCGGNYLFPGVPIYVQAPEYQAAQEPTYGVPRWIDFPGVDYRQIEGDLEIEVGVTILATPGHTVGHQSLQVETDSGLVVLTGQAIYCQREYEHIRDTGTLLPEYVTEGAEGEYLTSAERLLALPARYTFFSHESSVIERSLA